MDKYRELADLLRSLAPNRSVLLQGVVTELGELTCSVEVEGLVIDEVRLRASTAEEDAQLLVRPAIGSVVILGSLTGDLDQLVVLSCDKAEEVLLMGGHFGGLVKVGPLVDQLEQLERSIEELRQGIASWTPVPNDGGAALKASLARWTAKPLERTSRKKLENSKIRH